MTFYTVIVEHGLFERETYKVNEQLGCGIETHKLGLVSTHTMYFSVKLIDEWITGLRERNGGRGMGDGGGGGGGVYAGCGCPVTNDI